MLKKELLTTACVFCIFVNLGLLGFSTSIESTETQILAVLNILLLSFIFLKK